MAVALKIADHTQIVEFALRNRHQIIASRPQTVDQIFDLLKGLAKGTPQQARFNRVNRALVEYRRDVRDSAAITDRVGRKYWQEGLPILGRLLTYDGDLAGYEGQLLREARYASDPIAAGLTTAADILADGADTIYDPEHVIVVMMMDPRQFAGAMEAAAGKIKGVTEGILAGDAKGAAIGAVSGAAAGAVGAAITGVGVVAGAAAGAVTGAVAGAIEGSLSAVV